jgi:hypothetical protein
MNTADRYAAARRMARAWIARNDAPPIIERDCTAMLSRAIETCGLEKVCAGTIDRVCGEQLDRYVRAELYRTERKGAA